MGVFDFDGALFKTLWESRSKADFLPGAPVRICTKGMLGRE
jgi:hypothetical protein